MKIIYLFFTILISSFTLWSTEFGVEETKVENNRGNIQVIDCEGQKIYTAQLTMSNGDVAYFGSEPIYNEDRCQGWNNYAATVTDWCRSSDGLLYLFIKGLKEKHDKSCVIYDKFIQYNSENSPSTTTFLEHCDEYVKKFKTTSSKDSPVDPILDPLYDICNGTCIIIDEDIMGRRMNYISKKPVNGFFSFPQEELKENDFGDYIKAYDDIIMSVTSCTLMAEVDTYQHRGIFRNLLSMIRKDYKNISLHLHSFAAFAWHQEHPEVCYFFVQPDNMIHMKNILLEEFTKTELSSEGYLCTNQELKLKRLSIEKDWQDGERGSTIKDIVVIDIEALKQRFYKHFGN